MLSLALLCSLAATPSLSSSLEARSARLLDADDAGLVAPPPPPSVEPLPVGGRDALMSRITALENSRPNNGGYVAMIVVGAVMTGVSAVFTLFSYVLILAGLSPVFAIIGAAFTVVSVATLVVGAVLNGKATRQREAADKELSRLRYYQQHPEAPLPALPPTSQLQLDVPTLALAQF